MTGTGDDLGARERADQLETMIERAGAAAVEGDIDSVMALGQEVVRVAPDDPRGWMLLAAAQLEKGDHAGAERSARRSLRLDDSDAFCRYIIGCALLAQDKAEDARDWLVQARNELGDADSALALARCSLALKEPEDALLDLDGVTSDDAGTQAAINALRVLARHDLVLADHWVPHPDGDGHYLPTGPAAVREMRQVLQEAERYPVDDEGFRGLLERIQGTVDDSLSRQFGGRWAMGVFPILVGILLLWAGASGEEWPIAGFGLLYVGAGAAYFHAARYYAFELNGVWMSGKGDAFDRIADGVDRVVKGAERIHWGLATALSMMWLGVMVSIAVYGLPFVLLYHYIRQSRVRKALALA